MSEYSRALDSQMPELIKFIDMVFGFGDDSPSFGVSMPKVYGEDKCFGNIHHTVRENGELKSVIGLYPRNYKIAGRELKTGFVGSVSVHPDSRGKGYMKLLMQKVDEEMREKNLDVALLGGQRQRYRYFGYENAGVKLMWSVDTTNLRHELGTSVCDGLAVRVVESADDSALDAIYARYLRRSLVGRERDEFYDIARNYMETLCSIELNGECVGYLCRSADSTVIFELVLDDANLLLYVLRCVLADSEKDGLQVVTGKDELAVNEILAAACEGFELSCNLMMRIYNYPRVLETMLAAKAAYSPCAHGSVVLEVQGEGRFRMTVDADGCRVTQTQDEPDVSLTPNEVVRRLTSPEAYVCPVKGIPESWLPLHFYLTEPDAF